MSAQNSYSKTIAQAIAGLIAHVGTPTDIISRIAEGVVGFGVAVGRGTDPAEQAVIGLGAGYIGIAIRDTALENDPVGGEIVSYPDEKNIAVIRDGYVWGKLVAAQTPAIGGLVYFNETTGEFATADAAGVSLIDNAQFESVAQNGIALIRLGAATSTTAGV